MRFFKGFYKDLFFHIVCSYILYKIFGDSLLGSLIILSLFIAVIFISLYQKELADLWDRLLNGRRPELPSQSDSSPPARPWSQNPSAWKPPLEDDKTSRKGNER
jgi:hypothetical protein